jgi:hypothetical protein
MKRYILLVEVKAIELPEPEPEPRGGEDPMHQMVGVMRAAMPGIGAYVQNLPALQITAKAGISVRNFDELAGIVSLFEGMTSRVGVEHP